MWFKSNKCDYTDEIHEFSVVIKGNIDEAISDLDIALVNINDIKTDDSFLNTKIEECKSNITNSKDKLIKASKTDIQTIKMLNKVHKILIDTYKLIIVVNEYIVNSQKIEYINTLNNK